MCVMKLNKYFMIGAMGLSLVACSDNLDENGQGANGTNPNEGTTYVAFTLDFKGADSRAMTSPVDEDDTSEENNITTAYVVRAENGVIRQFVSNAQTTGTGDRYTSGKYLMKMEPGQYDFYAVVNPDGDAPEVNETIDAYFNTAVKLTLANVVADNNFMMASTEVESRTILDNVTEEEALAGTANSFNIEVERVSAKVTVTCDNPVLKAADGGNDVGGKLVEESTTFQLGGISNMAYRMASPLDDADFTSATYTTFFSNEENGQDIPVYFAETPGEANQHRKAVPAYCLENLHTTYNDHNTTYINLKTVFIPSMVVDCDAASPTTKQVQLSDPVDFYVVLTGDDALVSQYLLKSDLDTYQISHPGEYPTGITSISALYEGGECWFNMIWVGQEELGTSKTAPIYRNYWYNLAITSIRLPGDPEPVNPDPDDPPQPLEPQTNVAITLSVADWHFVSNDLVLGE